MNYFLAFVGVVIVFNYVVLFFSAYKHVSNSFPVEERRLLYAQGVSVFLGLIWPVIVALYILDITINRKNYKKSQDAERQRKIDNLKPSYLSPREREVSRGDAVQDQNPIRPLN